jgi:hypothetical protein
VKAPPEAQATDAERILIRALASARQMQPGRSIFPPAMALKKNSIPPARRSTRFQSEACIAGLAPNRWSKPCSMPGPKLPM